VSDRRCDSSCGGWEDGLRDYQSQLIDDFDCLAALRVRSAPVTAVAGSGNMVTLVTLAVAASEPDAGLLISGTPR
jgi:hypothetical protein